MGQKIAGVGLVVVLVGALVGGGAYVIMRSDGASAEGAPGGRGGAGAQATLDQCGGRGRGTTGAGYEERGAGSSGSGQSEGRVDGAGSDVGGWGNRGGLGSRGSQEPQPAAPVDHLTTVTGEVISLEDDMVLQTAEGDVSIGLGPTWYRDSLGYTPQIGAQVQVIGFYEGETFEAVAIEDLLTGEVFTLRDEGGRPMWAGRGRQGTF